MKPIVLQALALTALQADARRNTSPFVGEHKHAKTIDHGNGRISSKMTPVAASYNKYENLMVRDGLFQDRVSIFDRVSEAIFGK